MNTQFYINQAITHGNKKVQKLYEILDRPLTNVEMRLITRLSRIDEALTHEEAENLGFGNTAKSLRRSYKDVCRLLAQVCKKENDHRKWLNKVDFHQFDMYL